MNPWVIVVPFLMYLATAGACEFSVNRCSGLTSSM